MIRLISAEFRKLFSVRSTYAFLAFCLAITIFFAFYVEGIKPTHAITDPHKLYSEVTSALMALGIFFSLVGILLVTHEYRYNTIMYTLTSSNSRLKVLLAKVIAVSCFALLASAFFGTLSPLLTSAGLHLKGTSVVAQTIPIWDTAWRALFYGWAFAMLGFIIAVIIRSQVGAIITFVVAPGTAEALLGLLLKDNTKYLPFTALNSVLGGEGARASSLPPSKAALYVAVYVVVGLVVAAILFKRRDAN